MHVCHEHCIIMIYSKKKKVVEVKEIFLVIHNMEVKSFSVSVTVTTSCFFDLDIIIKPIRSPTHPNQWGLISQVSQISQSLIRPHLYLLFISLA